MNESAEGAGVQGQAATGTTVWSAPNPFGEPTSFILVHPLDRPDSGELAEAIERLGLKRLDEDGDILPIGTETLYAALRGIHVQLCTPDEVWITRPVTDEWTGNAIGRRYIVLAVGTEPLSDEAGPDEISAYLARRDRVYTGLVKIRVRFEQS